MDRDDGLKRPKDSVDLSGFPPAPIPAELHSSYDGAPFSACTVCSETLLDGRLYEVQKVYRGRECIFEMSVCHTCGESVCHEFSEESLEAIKGFLLCNFQPTPQPNRCHFCGFPRPLIRNFTIVGACSESSLILPSIVMCDKCSEKLQECLSRRTREVQGEFIQDYFPGIPANFDVNPSFGNIL